MEMQDFQFKCCIFELFNLLIDLPGFCIHDANSLDRLLDPFVTVFMS